MRIKQGFALHEICGENIIVAEGKENIDFNRIISLNETSAYLWKKLAGKEFTIQEMAELLCGEYEVEKEVALADCTELAEKWLSTGIIED